MAFFRDLTPYRYGLDYPEQGVLNVGWLGRGNPFCAGDVPPEFVDAIDSLCARPIKLHRGFHGCEFCSNAGGNGQIRVLDADGVWYAAPTLLHHYVVEHRYHPPIQFIEAVLGGVFVAIEAARIEFWPREAVGS